MKRAILVGFVVVVFASVSSGQHLGELSANYSYLHFVPVDNLPTVNLNGGGGSAVRYFAGFFRPEGGSARICQPERQF